MAYQPNVNWVNDAPPGFDADEMVRMQLGIADAHAIGEDAALVAAQAAADAASATKSPTVRRILVSPNPEEPLSEGDLLLVYQQAEATYYTDFADGTIGSPPEGWTDRWNATAWAITEDATSTSGKVLYHPSGPRSFLSWDETYGTDTEALVKARCLTSDPAQTLTGGVMVRGGGTDATATGYALLILSETAARLGKYDGGTFSLLGTAAFAVPATSRYWLRLRAVGDQVMGKAWLDGDPEPAEWLLTATDTAISGPGYAGVVSGVTNSESSYDLVGVGLNGATAPGAS